MRSQAAAYRRLDLRGDKPKDHAALAGNDQSVIYVLRLATPPPAGR